MIPTALLLIFTGPWLVYLLIRVPDQLAEYRNYSMCAGFALLASQLPFYIWPQVLCILLTMSHVHAGVWREALTMWRYAKDRTSGDRSRVEQEVGAYLKIAQKNDEAEPHLRKAIALNPRLAPAIENLASICMQNGRHDEGFALVKGCTESNPKYAPGWQFLGLLYEERKEIELAKRAYQTACELQSIMPQSANRLGLLAFQEKQFDEALTWFERARKYFPDHPDYIFNQVNALYALKREEDGHKLRAKLANRPLMLTREMIQPEMVQAV